MNPELPQIPEFFDLTIRGVGEIIYRLRTEKGWTQEKLAKAIRCLRTDVVRYENNTVGVPYSRLMAIALAVGLNSPQELLQRCLEFAEKNGVPLTNFKSVVKEGRAAEINTET